MRAANDGRGGGEGGEGGEGEGAADSEVGWWEWETGDGRRERRNGGGKR